MPTSIFSTQVIESMRDNGYKSTASAVAEIIDNSIEAGAEKIAVVTFEEKTKQKRKPVHSIAIYDDGGGMSPEVMECALQFGGGTRHNNNSGMGRFGMGLPNASVSACKKVTVYSWRKNKCYSSCLDIAKIIASEDLTLEKPRICKIPESITKELGYKIKESGTIILWEDCDKLDFVMAKTLFNRMEGDLCRIFRHFLDNDNDYGKRVEIKLIKPAHNAAGYKSDRVEHVLKANDPLYLLTPNNCPGYEDEAIAYLQDNKVHKMEFITIRGKGTVELRLSICKPEIHWKESAKQSKFMRHLDRNKGISFVRACREIQHGDFGHLITYESRERWWGVEIRFPPVLDELFGVTNNKQSVKGMRCMDEKEMDAILEDLAITDGQKEDYLKSLEGQKLDLKIWINKVLASGISRARKEIKSRKESSGSQTKGKENSGDAASEAITKVLEKERAQSRFDKEAREKDDKKARDELAEKLREANKGLDKDELDTLVKQVEHYKIHIEVSSWAGDMFFETELQGLTPIVKLNSRHPFYSDIYLNIQDNHPEALNALKVLIMSYAWTEAEYPYSEESRLIEKINSKWGYYTKEILHQLNEAK
jgi:hypothetical protein